MAHSKLSSTADRDQWEEIVDKVLAWGEFAAI